MARASGSKRESADAGGAAPRLSVPPHVRDTRDAVLAFVEHRVYPLEAELRRAGHGSSPSADGGHGIALEQLGKIKALQDAAKAAGLWALGHPREIGGGGMSFRDYVYVNEVMGRSDLAPLVLGSHSLQDSLMLHAHAPPALKDKYLAPLVAADIYPSFAMTEPDTVSSDPTGIQTRADLSPDGQHWIITGRKWWTTGASMAAFTSVMARTEHGDVPAHFAFSIILVPTDTPGYRIVRSTSVLGTGGVDHSEVVYDAVRVPVGNLIGDRGAGFLIAQQRLGPGRIFHCMRWLGQAQRAFDLMCARLAARKLRKGRRLGDLQLMQQMVYDSYVDINSHRLLTLAAAEAMDAGGMARVELAAAKAHGARVLGRVLDRAVQVWGAKGLSDDTPLSSMIRHARAARLYDGPDEVHVATVGRLVMRVYKRGERLDLCTGTCTKASPEVEATLQLRAKL